MSRELAVGDPAPDFYLLCDGGGNVSLQDFKGRALALFFYPKADTSGCTREAQAFSALAEAFSKAGASVLGASADPVRAQERFKQKYGLGIPLASDEARKTLGDYGVWVEKSMYGRKYMGIERATFLIEANGRLAKIWRKVKVDGHAEEVLAAVRVLTAPS